MTREETCAERIDRHRVCRIEHFARLTRLAAVYDADTLAEACDDVAEAMAEGDLPRHAGELEAQAIAEAAQEALWALPLGCSARMVFSVELSTGGPADWLEVFAEPERHEHYTSYTVERIVYHFADWYDHAETTLEGADFDTAEAFARSVVPELAE